MVKFLEQVNLQWRAITVIIASIALGGVLGRFTSIPTRIDSLEIRIENSLERTSRNEVAIEQLTSQISRLICVTNAEREQRSTLGC